MDRNNGPAKPIDICHRLFNFLVKNFSFDRFKQVSQGRTNATIPKQTSPSTWKDKESQVPVTVYKDDEATVYKEDDDDDDNDARLVPPTVVTVEHQAAAPKASGKRNKDSITSKGQDVGAPSVEPRKKSITIRDGTGLPDVLGKEGSTGERGKAGETEKKPPRGPRPKQPNPFVAPDINEESGKFIAQKKDDWRRSHLRTQ